MNALRAVSLTYKLLQEHGRNDWIVRLNGRLSRSLALTRYGPQVIDLCRGFVQLNDEETVLATIRHEVAHVLVGPGEGHGPVFRQMCVKLGGCPKPYMDVPTSPYHWISRCPICGAVIRVPNRPGPRTRYQHRPCADREHRLRFKRVSGPMPDVVSPVAA